MDLNDLDAPGGPFRILADGEVVSLPAATTLRWRTVAAVASNPHVFITTVWPFEAEVAAWKIDYVQRAWLRHQGIPEGPQVARLIQMMERYGEGIEYDLQHHLGLSAGQLFRERRWRELLNHIDHLPADSHKNMLLANDEEHLEAVMRQSGRSRGAGGGPSMSDWSLTNSLLATLIDAVNRNSAVTQAVAGAKGKNSYDPHPRPATAADRVRYRMEKEAHENMNDVLLRGR